MAKSDSPTDGKVQGVGGFPRLGLDLAALYERLLGLLELARGDVVALALDGPEGADLEAARRRAADGSHRGGRAGK